MIEHIFAEILCSQDIYIFFFTYECIFLTNSFRAWQDRLPQKESCHTNTHKDHSNMRQIWRGDHSHRSENVAIKKDKTWGWPQVRRVQTGDFWWAEATKQITKRNQLHHSKLFWLLFTASHDSLQSCSHLENTTSAADLSVKCSEFLYVYQR